MTRARQVLGASGEEQAAAWYAGQGFTVLARNWRCSAGELDVVVGRGGLVVFAEVKARSSSAFGHPTEQVSVRQQLRVRRAAAAWLAEHRVRAGEVRFDVVSVLAGQLEVVTAAF